DPGVGGVAVRHLLSTDPRPQPLRSDAMALALRVNAPGPVADIAAVREDALNDGPRPVASAARARHGPAVKLLGNGEEAVSFVVQPEDQPHDVSLAAIRGKTLPARHHRASLPAVAVGRPAARRL